MSRPKKQELKFEEVQETENKAVSENKTVSITVGFEEKKIEGDKNTVSFKVDYPKDYQASKFFKQGTVREISLESALLFEKQGIGKIIK